MVDSINFQSVGDRLPPQNIEAEESILGGILIDPEAINRVADQLTSESFSLEAHKIIYRATSTLHSQGKPTDLLTVMAWLADHKLLDKIGGQSKLVQLVDRTVSAVNIDQYAKLIVDKYLRRKLIHVGHEITQLGYDTAKELPIILDEAEEKVFDITQERPQQGLVSISETLIHTFQELEIRNQELTLPGLTCDFYDLDAMTGGFQRSDLIIVAGRPSMGKTSFSVSIAQNIAGKHRLPIAVFSLEMSKEQLVQRMLSSEAEIESNRLRSGRISQNEWDVLSRALGVLTELPIYIDDSANITVTEMKSQARRLQAEIGGELGLILIDYLQLMEGGGDNRVQELSKITRSLKGLARELNVPVIALSQLSRGVEARTNKRPMMADLRESGCLTGDTLVTLADSGVQVPICSLVGKSGFAVWALNQTTMKLEKAIVSNAFSTGIKPVLKLTTRLGRTIKATGNHKFLTINGWQRLDELKVYFTIALPSFLPTYETTVSQLSFTRTRADQVALIVKYDEIKRLATSDVYWDEIISIEADGEAEVYDLTVPYFHNFIANNIVVHNSIEQDADLVIMLYRDEYYNPDTPDRGVAEIIITKHRNGPTGAIKLLFDPQFTRFRNMASPHRG
jgi:replicative DNA helicase